MLDLQNIEVMSFDCYGTLIDWEHGILSTLRPLLSRHGREISEDVILARYAQFESAIQAGPYRNYRSLLRDIVERLGREFDFVPGEAELRCLENTLPNWRPFPDTVEALKELKAGHQLAVLSNIDDDLFAATARQFPVQFDHILTAQQLGSYKPALQNFRALIECVRVPKERILHVAQSIYHDIVPAKLLGLATVWVNRRQDRTGFGATPPSSFTPDLEVPDLRTLVLAIGR